VDAFTFVILGGVAALVLAVVVIAKIYPGSGADILDWKPTRSLETEVELELEDIGQMLEAQNERRRQRGEPDRTEEDIEREIAEHIRDQERRKAELRAERERGTDPERER
jgi:DNA-binding transcriptional MerR regulator